MNKLKSFTLNFLVVALLGTIAALLAVYVGNSIDGALSPKPLSNLYTTTSPFTVATSNSGILTSHASCLGRDAVVSGGIDYIGTGPGEDNLVLLESRRVDGKAWRVKIRNEGGQSFNFRALARCDKLSQ